MHALNGWFGTKWHGLRLVQQPRLYDPTLGQGMTIRFTNSSGLAFSVSQVVQPHARHHRMQMVSGARAHGGGDHPPSWTAHS